MSKNYAVLNERLAELMQSQGHNISTLSKAAGVAVGTIQKLLHDPNCNPTIASLDAIGRVLKTTVSYLIGQTGISLSSQLIPLLDWQNIITTISNEKTQKASPTVPITSKTSPNAFALVMSGNSMQPIFPEGCQLVFDPNKQPHDHSYILIQLEHETTPVFKQLVLDTPKKYMRSCNPSLPSSNLILIPPTAKIIATLIESKMTYD